MISHPRKIGNADNIPRQKNKTMIPKEEICENNCENVTNLLSKMSKPAKQVCEFFDRAPRAGTKNENDKNRSSQRSKVVKARM